MNPTRILPPILLAASIVGVGYGFLSTRTEQGAGGRQIEVIEVRDFKQGRGTYRVDHEIGKEGRMIVRGKFTLTGGTFVMGRHKLEIFGDIHIGRNTSFIPSDAPIIHHGTGHKVVTPATYATEATYIRNESGSVIGVRTATGTLLTETGVTFYGKLHVEKKEVTIPARYRERAVYSGSTLIHATGSLLTATGTRVITPSLGNLHIE